MHGDENPWTGAVRVEGLAIDHIGIVVADLGPTLSWLRGLGFHVNDGEPLMGDNGPLGQTSAHCILANGYVEISAPDRGSGNHLEPLLARGPGVRILALASSNIAADHARFAARGLAAGAPSPSSRQVRLAKGPAKARFEWFPLIEVVPGVIAAVVEHRDREIVFAPELRLHPNGARELADVLIAAPAGGLEVLAGGTSTCSVAALTRAGLAEGIAGFSIAGIGRTLERRDGFAMRGVP